jgi:hypothetical protein
VPMLTLIFLMSSLFWMLLAINELSSWVWVVAIWIKVKNGKENGIGGE